MPIVYESKPVEALAPVSEPPRGEALARRLIAPNGLVGWVCSIFRYRTSPARGGASIFQAPPMPLFGFILGHGGLLTL